MLFAILHDGTKTVAAKRIPDSKHWMANDYQTVRAWIEQVFPGRTVLSPLESLPKGAQFDQITAYASPNKEGHGRVVSKPDIWLVLK